MNEQLKQAIESWILQDQRRVDKQSHLGLCLLVLQQISILRHADPEIMKQAGWVREEEWISVEDRLPKGVWNNSEQIQLQKYSEQVNIFVDNGAVGTGAYNRDSKKWFVNDLTPERYIELERTQVTHWKPLPQPPKQ